MIIMSLTSKTAKNRYATYCNGQWKSMRHNIDPNFKPPFLILCIVFKHCTFHFCIVNPKIGWMENIVILLGVANIPLHKVFFRFKQKVTILGERLTIANVF